MPEINLVLRGRQVALAQSVSKDQVRASGFGPQKTLASRRALLAPASIHIQNGIITAIAGYDDIPQGCRLETVDEDSIVMPVLVDTHVHLNEPGRTEWEGFASATRAAAAGGVTTLVDMPLNSIPPTVDVEALAVKRRVAADQAYVDVGFWGGAVPGNVPDLRALHDAGV